MADKWKHRNTGRRVVLASTGVGADCDQAARALLARLRTTRPDIDADFVDVLDFTPAAFRLYYAGGYGTLVSRFPRLFGLGYDLTNRPTGPDRTASERIRLGLERRMTRRFRQWLMERRPVLVVNTHYLAAPGIAHMIEAGGRGVRQMVVVTDYEVHRWWYAEAVQTYFVAAPACREQLMAYGIAPSHIALAGIPVHPKWRESLDVGRIRAAWNVPAEADVVVLTGGVEFTVNWVKELAAELCARLPTAYIFALCGTNKRLSAQLSGLPAARGEGARLRVCGLTDRVHELVAMATVVVTKAGGLMVTECLTKAAAMVLPRPIPGQETANARMLQREGAALVASSPRQTVDMTVALVRDPAQRERLRANAGRLAKPATSHIADAIAEYIDDGDWD